MADAPRAAPDRSRPPEAPPQPPFRLPEFDRRTVGGLEILVHRRSTLPIVNLSLIATRAGGDEQPAAGVASLAASLLTEGTEKRSTVEFAEAAEQLGGFVSSGADWDAAAVHAGSLSEHLDDTVGLVAESFLEAAFRSQDVDRVRSRRISELARRASDPGSMAAQALLGALYRGTPYEHQLLGTRDSLGALDEDRLRSFWSEASAAGACLVAAGDVSIERLEDAARRHLRPLVDAEPPDEVTRVLPPEPPQGMIVHLVDRPAAVQTQLLMGHAGPSRLDPDRPALRLLNAIFGGKFSSRINLNLRERHGFTYGASSSFSARRGPGPFVVQAAVETENAGESVRQVLHEMRRIREEPVPADELEDARSYLLGVQPYGFQTIEGWVSALGTLGVFDLDSDFYDRQQKALARVDAAQLTQVAGRHLRPDELVAVLVGPKATLASQFTDFDVVDQVPT